MPSDIYTDDQQLVEITHVSECGEEVSIQTIFPYYDEIDTISIEDWWQVVDECKLQLKYRANLPVCHVH